MPQSEDTRELQSLLEQSRSGPADEYDQLIERSAARLLSLTRRMLRNYPQLRRWEQTDDVFQNAVLRLHRSLRDVRPDSLRGFLGLASLQIRRTLVDLARYHFGPEGRHAKHQSNGDGAIPWDDSSHRDKGSEPHTLQGWAVFHDCVSSLPAAEREVFELTWYHELDQEKISECVGVSLSTVKRRLRRARLMLADAVEQPTE